MNQIFKRQPSRLFTVIPIFGYKARGLIKMDLLSNTAVYSSHMRRFFFLSLFCRVITANKDKAGHTGQSSTTSHHI